MRTRITLACTECKQRNYNTTKDKKKHPERMETKKYCKFAGNIRCIRKRNKIGLQLLKGVAHGRFRKDR